MANEKITDLPAGSVPNDTDLFEMSQNVTSTPVSHKVTPAQLVTYLAGTFYSPGDPTTILENDGEPYLFIGNNAGNVSSQALNLGVGNNSLNAVTAATQCTILGMDSGYSITTGAFNTAVGSRTLQICTTNTRATAIGEGAMQNAQCEAGIGIGAGALQVCTATDNIAIGVLAMANNVASPYNVCIGNNCGLNLTSDLGSDNVFIGFGTAVNQSQYGGCTFIGSGADTTINALINSTAIGFGARVEISDAISLGANCFVGMNKSSPAYTIHGGNVGNICALALDFTVSAPATPTGACVYYFDTASGAHYKNPAGVDSYVALEKSTICGGSVQGVAYTTINSAPSTILTVPAAKTIKVKNVLIYATTAVTGANIVIQNASGTPIVTFASVALTTGALLDMFSSLGVTIGLAYDVDINNQAISITSDGTLTAGVINVTVEYMQV